MNDHKTSDKLITGYKSLLSHTRHFFEEATDIAEPRVRYALEYASEKTSELGELTREEAEKVGNYLLRDAHEAGRLIAEGERGLADLLRLDILYLEESLVDAFSNMIDHTRLGIEHLREDAVHFGEWHTGDVTSMGTLKCRECGQHIHFKATGHVPPCPSCHGTHFVRDSD